MERFILYVPHQIWYMTELVIDIKGQLVDVVKNCRMNTNPSGYERCRGECDTSGNQQVNISASTRRPYRSTGGMAFGKSAMVVQRVVLASAVL